MTRSIRGARRAAAVLTGTAAATTLLLTGCGTGQIAETAGKVPTSVGANAQSADNTFKVRNLSIDYLNTTGYPAGADAPLNVGLYNDSAEAVTVRITTTGARAVVLAGPAPSPAGTISPSPTPATTSGSPTPGSPTPGSPTPGDATPGDATPGDATPGGATPGSPRPGGSASATPSGGAPASPSAAPAPGTPAEIQLPAGGFVILNKSVGSWLQLTGLSAAVPPGSSVPMTFDFGGTTVEIAAPVAVPFTPAPTGSRITEEGGGGHE